jgi:hypothetical protein
LAINRHTDWPTTTTTSRGVEKQQPARGLSQDGTRTVGGHFKGSEEDGRRKRVKKKKRGKKVCCWAGPGSFAAFQTLILTVYPLYARPFWTQQKKRTVLCLALARAFFSAVCDRDGCVYCHEAGGGSKYPFFFLFFFYSLVVFFFVYSQHTDTRERIAPPCVARRVLQQQQQQPKKEKETKSIGIENIIIIIIKVFPLLGILLDIIKK